MKHFKNPIHRTEFVNQYGETMSIVMSANSSVWIHHDDCNEDFENISTFSLNFILNVEEQNAITTFIKECEVILQKMIKDLEN